MQLTPQQQALLDGAQGETMAKVVKTLVMYGDTFGAQRMVPVTSQYGHTVISFGLAVMKPVYDLYDRLIEAGLTSGQKFTADPGLWTRMSPPVCWRTSSSARSCIPSRRATRSSSASWASPTTAATPAPVTWIRWATSPPRATSQLGGVLRRGLCQLRAGRTLQPQQRYAGADGQHRRLRAGVRPAHRRGAQGPLAGGGEMHPPSRPSSSALPSA